MQRGQDGNNGLDFCVCWAGEGRERGAVVVFCIGKKLFVAQGDKWLVP